MLPRYSLGSPSATLFLPIAVLTAGLVSDPSIAVTGLVVGVIASHVQAIGLLRWVFPVPHLARAADGPTPPG